MSPSPRMGRMGRLAVEGVFVLIVLLLLLAVLEGVVRLIGEDAKAPRPASQGSADGLPVLHSTADLAMPDTRGLNAGALYQTNSAGFRGPDSPEEKPPGVFRVAVIGDSTAMGWGVEWEDTYPVRIERRLNSPPPPPPPRVSESAGGDEAPRFEVLNFALAGLDAGGVSERFESLALRFDPDLVIYGFTLNDIKGPHYRRSLDRDYAESLMRNDSPIRMWRWARPRWLAIRELLFAPTGSYAGELDDNYFDNPPAWQALRTHLEQIARSADERSMCRILLIHCQIQSLNAWHPYRRHYDAVAELARQHGFLTVQSIDRMSAQDASSLWVSASDWHANARGHAILAELALEAMQELPDDCWERPAPASR